MRTRTDRTAGILLTLASTAFFALAGIFTKAASTDPWTIACWRGLIGGLLIGGYVLWMDRAKPLRLRFALGARGWVLAATGAVSSLAFIASFKLTYVANVSIAYATAPFMAAFIEWAFRGERARSRTLLASSVSLVGVCVMVVGSFGGGHLLGDALALFMTFLCAVYLVMIRAWRDIPVVWAGGVAALIVCVGTLPFADMPGSVSAYDASVMVAFGFSFACAVILWTEGARLIPASESGFLGSAEVPLAIAFSWAILSELPPAESFVGGAIVLCAVVGYTLSDMRDELRKPQTTTVV
ncbi:MAG: DMT family transporter [Rhizobiaceae bacterium]